MSPDSDVEQEYGEVAEEVVITSEEPVAGSSSNTSSLPDHDYNIYRVNKKNKVAVVNTTESTEVQDEQMEAVAQSVAAAAQEKEKLKRKRGTQMVFTFHSY